MYDVVVPTVGRPSLGRLLGSLDASEGPLPGRVFVVDDRRDRSRTLALGDLHELGERICVVASAAAGPAAARNRGWIRSRAPWIAFLDDDVVVEPAWRRKLVADFATCAATDAGSQGRVTVPIAAGRLPTDWERNVRGLENARYITADCAYRRSALCELDGFDERFPRAYREDAEFALRLLARGRSISIGQRRIAHPVRPAGAWISLRLQAGNADDALMRALHGSDWFERAGAQRGRFARHARTVAYGGAALTFGAFWAASTAQFAWERIAPGPRDAREIATMLVTSAAIPFAAVFHRVRGIARVRRALARTHSLPAAVLFDRDGTLVCDDPQLRKPAQLRLVPGARDALQRLRAAGLDIGIVTNQPGVGEGRLREGELASLHAGLDELAGPFATIAACTHARDTGCACRKPAPGLVVRAAAALGIEPRDCVVVGDIGSDVVAAQAAGARAILVPTRATLRPEIDAAPVVARDLREAVDLILGGRV